MHIRVVWLAGLAATMGLWGCGPAQGFSRLPVRPATDVPGRFLVAGSSGSESARSPRPGEGCHSPVMDPRDGTLLHLSRSLEGLGDYTVPAGVYGTAADELLRIDCRTGQAIGIVPR